MILVGKTTPSVLFIERAKQAGDPWSGQIAFPGGKAQPGDAGAKGTATRETAEEVGIDLGRNALFLGYAEPAVTHTGAIEVVPCVFLLNGEVSVRPNEEVASYKWIALDRLLDSGASTTRSMEAEGRKVDFPAIAVSGYTIWGLTYRILLSVLDMPESTA